MDLKISPSLSLSLSLSLSFSLSCYVITSIYIEFTFLRNDVHKCVQLISDTRIDPLISTPGKLLISSLSDLDNLVGSLTVAAEYYWGAGDTVSLPVVMGQFEKSEYLTPHIRVPLLMESIPPSADFTASGGRNVPMGRPGNR